MNSSLISLKTHCAERADAREIRRGLNVLPLDFPKLQEQLIGSKLRNFPETPYAYYLTRRSIDENNLAGAFERQEASCSDLWDAHQHAPGRNY
ncbi:hypothetical protein TNCV_2683891 [Trichonephila clavipes]|nr:hypothetical protein TNCV_2683891 [Trichonephila clavipes]